MKNMYVINGRFLTKRVTGVERYAIEMVRELDELVEPGQIIMAVPINATLPQLNNIEIKTIGKLKDILWEQISLPLYALKNKLIPLNFCNIAPLLYPGVVVVHDVKVKARPEFFDWKFRLWYRVIFANIAERAERIITVSNFSKKEIMKYMGVKDKRIEIIPCAWSHFDKILEDKSILSKFKLKKDQYFFSMSSLEPNKNFKWIAEVARKHQNYLFVIAGSINSKVFAREIEFECPSNMKFLGYISDGEAKALMHYCKAFIFPTQYEGFGLPPLEALGAGCRSIVISDTEVMHEIYGNLGTYIDPAKYEFEDKNIKIITNDEANTLLNKYQWGGSARLLQVVLQSKK